MQKKQKTPRKFRLTLGHAPKAIKLPPGGGRKLATAVPVKATVAAQTLVRALKATARAREIIAQVPSLADFHLWLPVATFSVCQKTGTAKWLDLWDCDHFDGFTDMQRCLSDCRAWFSDQGYTTWGSAQTHTGRINCYFTAPVAGNYVCNVQLQSHGGPAMVECLIDSFNYGPLPFNGSINQPHPASLSAGGHHFRIRQMSGAFFFISLTVWRV